MYSTWLPTSRSLLLLSPPLTTFPPMYHLSCATPTLCRMVSGPRPQAFAAALAAIQMSVTDLLGLPVSDLRTLLMFHMVPNAITAANVPEVDTVLSTLA